MSSEPNAAVEVLAELSDIVTPMLEAVQGYRAQAESQGFSPTAAEKMAMEYHSALMQMVAANLVVAVTGKKI